MCNYLVRDTKVQLGQQERATSTPDNTPQFYVKELRGKEKRQEKTSTVL